MDKNNLSIIFIAGAPGSGKSTIAKILQENLKTPCFEFGWIPEFQDKGDGQPIGYVEEEAIAFENLVLVVKNYIKHGFKNIIVTDLEDKRILELNDIFAGVKYKIFTLLVNDNEILKSRVLDDSRSSGYRDFDKAIEINKTITNRTILPNEVRLLADGLSVEDITNKILSAIC